jgi:hypothetical protein
MAAAPITGAEVWAPTSAARLKSTSFRLVMRSSQRVDNLLTYDNQLVKQKFNSGVANWASYHA